MLDHAAVVPGADALADGKAYLRIVGGDEDALLLRLLASAIALGEQFTRQMLIARTFTERVSASSAWTRLSARPVRSIDTVEALGGDGAPIALAAGAYAIDIDANGDGWLRVTDASEARSVRATYQAGLAATWAETPEPLRQGVLRLTAHFFTHRDAAVDAGPPAAVTALWRPYRRMRID